MPFQLCFPAFVYGILPALNSPAFCLIRQRNSIMLTVNASSQSEPQGEKTCWNPFKAPWGFLFESSGAQAAKIALCSATFIEWWCMGNNLKAMETDNLAFNRCGCCKWTQIGEKVLSLVKAAVTQWREMLLSSEMNLLNNLCLMGLSIIFWFCAHLYFSLFTAYVLSAIIWSIIHSPFLPLLCSSD